MTAYRLKHLHFGLAFLLLVGAQLVLGQDDGLDLEAVSEQQPKTVSAASTSTSKTKSDDKKSGAKGCALQWP